tara:strand:+ start:520 stop:921 length:402 start_codon:yes stop_codon:yes gene_type:complete
MVYTIMIDPFSNFRKYMTWTFILIIFLIISGIAIAGEKSEWLNDNPCMIKVVITNKEICKDSMCLIRETITEKEEVLECKDGYDGPNYWELFAQFYYSGITQPAYCRPYARPNHPFKTPGMLCLTEDGVWEKQ